MTFYFTGNPLSCLKGPSLKLLLTMKLTVLLLLAVCLHASAKVEAQTITYTKKSVSLEKALKEITKQTGYQVLYNSYLVGRTEKISLNLDHSPLRKALDIIFKNQPLTYSIVENIIVIGEKNNHPQDSASALPELKEVHGTVMDSSSGKPLIGVTIRVKGSTIGTTTDINGYFSLNVPDNSILEVSFLGYSTKEIVVNTNTNLKIVLSATTTGLNQLVVIGYGTQKKGEETGSISILDYDKTVKSRPVVNTLEALQGKIAGVTVTRQSGQPGLEGYDFKIRGTSSINGNAPLVLIDGIPGDMNSLNPNDIKTITVLKDASAAIYGARASDGVILITTLQGRKSTYPSIAYSYNLALKKVSFIKKPATTEHFVKMFNQANSNDGDPQTFSDETLKKIAQKDAGTGPGENWNLESYPMFYQSRDWYGALFKPVLQQTHSLRISGGSNHSDYLVSGGYMNDKGNVVGNNNSFERYNLRMNLHYQLLENLNFYANVSYSDQITKSPSELGDAIDNALKVFSYVPFKNPSGNYYTYQGYQNPFQELKEGGSSNIDDSKLNNNFKIDWEPVNGLTWTGQAGINIEEYNNDFNFPTFYGYNWDNSLNSLPRNLPNSASYNHWRSLYRNLTTYVNYTKNVADNYFHIMIGTSTEKFKRRTENMSGSDFISNQIFPLPLSDPKNLNAGDLWDNDSWGLLSYFGRFNYSFKRRYFVDFTLRKDGSSKFSPSKRWSEIYPAVSAGWILSNEPLFKDITNNNTLNLVKVRASWGRMGNQNIPALGLFDYIQQINIGGRYPIDGSTASKMASLNGIAAPDRTWETIVTKDLGIDFGLFDSKLSVSFDLYNKKNIDMLVNVIYPATLGAAAPTSNAGSMYSKGWDLQANWESMIGPVKLNAGVIISYNTNKLTNLKGQDTYSVGLNATRQGYPLNSFFGYDGKIIRTQSELDDYAAKYAGKGIIPATQPNGQKGLGVGDVMYEDLNGDGKITAYGDGDNKSDGDVVYLGTADPKLTYSLNLGLAYKNFDFNILLQGTGNKYTWRGNGAFGVPLSQYFWPPLDYFYNKTFSATDVNAPYPRLSNNGSVKSNNYQFSNIWLVNTRYVKIENLSIGYTFKGLKISRLSLNEPRIYFSGENLFTFSKGTWDNEYDPEENSSETNYPMYKTFSFGIDINF